MNTRKNGKPSRAWKALLSRDPRKKSLVSLVKGAIHLTRPELQGVSLRLTNVKIREGISPIFIKADVLSRMDIEGRTMWKPEGTFTTDVIHPQPGVYMLPDSAALNAMLEKKK